MELKPNCSLLILPTPVCLNRTFYGIETNYNAALASAPARLNRTFYGIETRVSTLCCCCRCVLIVPFMELKLIRLFNLLFLLSVLIVPFMELKRRTQRSKQFGSRS